MFSIIHVVCLERILWKEKHLPLLLSLIVPFILNLSYFNHNQFKDPLCIYCIYDISCHSIKADAEQQDLFLYFYILIQGNVSHLTVTVTKVQFYVLRVHASDDEQVWDILLCKTTTL